MVKHAAAEGGRGGGMQQRRESVRWEVGYSVSSPKDSPPFQFVLKTALLSLEVVKWQQ